MLKPVSTLILSFGLALLLGPLSGLRAETKDCKSYEDSIKTLLESQEKLSEQGEYDQAIQKGYEILKEILLARLTCSDSPETVSSLFYLEQTVRKAQDKFKASKKLKKLTDIVREKLEGLGKGDPCRVAEANRENLELIETKYADLSRHPDLATRVTELKDAAAKASKEAEEACEELKKEAEAEKEKAPAPPPSLPPAPPDKGGYRWVDDRGAVHLWYNVKPDANVGEYSSFETGTGESGVLSLSTTGPQ